MKSGWLLYAGGMFVFLFGAGDYWSATWLSKWAVILGLFVATICFRAAQRTSLLYLPVMTTVSASLIALSLWPQNPYKDQFDQVTVLALKQNALNALVIWLATMLGFAFMAQNLSKKPLRCLLASIWAIGTFGYLSLPLHGIHSCPNNGMWFGNPSMGGSLLACLMPFAMELGIEHLPRPGRKVSFQVCVWVLTWLAVLKTNASVPWGVLGVVTAALLITKCRLTRRSVASVAIVALSMITAGKYLLGSDFWDQNGRFEIWRMAWDWFLEHANQTVGMGFSTSQILLPIEQTLTGHFHGDYFLWLHNDWLQLLIEGGSWGMVCILIAVGRLLWVSWGQPALFASICGFITLGLFNYPLRMPIHSMCLLLICAMIEASAKTRVVEFRVPRALAPWRPELLASTES